MRGISVESSGSQVLHEIGRVRLISHQYRITALTSELGNGNILQILANK